MVVLKDGIEFFYTIFAVLLYVVNDVSFVSIHVLYIHVWDLYFAKNVYGAENVLGVY